MMPYRGYYWTILAPMMKKSIRKRYGDALADKSISCGKPIFRELLQKADDVGPGNPMAVNAYFAYAFAAVYLGSDKELTPDDISIIMQDILHVLKPFFGVVNLNTKRGSTMWYRNMKKYEKWCEENLAKYPTTWKVGFDEKLHRDGSFYYFTQCPICSFCQREGLGELMAPLCATDKVMFAMQHGVLHRDYTIASGDAMCDYWIVGDKVKNPK